jgi:putative endonuclease
MSLASRLKPTNYQSGVDAEGACGKYLTHQGYEIIAARYKTKFGEIDLIARNKKELLFIEVKRRKGEIIDDPVSAAQKKRIINAALQYIAENENISTLNMRFDCILVDNELGINHIKDSWRIEEI